MIRSTLPSVDAGPKLRRINEILSSVPFHRLEAMRDGLEARGWRSGALSKLVSLELRGRSGLRPCALVDGVRYYYARRRF